MGFISAIFNGVKLGLKLTGEFIVSPAINVWKWLVTKTKRLVDSRNEWLDNARTLLKKRYSNWLSGLIFTAGLVLFTISFLPMAPIVASAAIITSASTAVIFLLDTLFVNSDNGASGKKKLMNFTHILHN